MLLHMLLFLWQRALRCKMLSLRCSFLELCIWHFPCVFLDICANVFIFTTEDVSWKMASIQCSFLRIGSGPFLRLSFPLWNMLPSSWLMTAVGKPFPYPPNTESYICGSFLKVQHTYEETLVSLLINIALSLYNLGSLNWLVALSFRFYTTFLNGIPLHDRCEWRDAFCVVFLT